MTRKMILIPAGLPHACWVVVLSLLTAACVGTRPDPLSGADGDSDSDSDSESETETDSDSDTSVDTGTNTDASVYILQNGLDGYEGCEDTYLWMDEYKTVGANVELSVQGYH